MKLGFLLLSFLFSVSAMADCSTKTGMAKTRCECFESMPEVDNAERSCQKDSDCQVIPDKCGGWATFNPGAVEKYKKLFEKIIVPTKVEASKVSAACKVNICRIQIKK